MNARIGLPRRVWRTSVRRVAVLSLCGGAITGCAHVRPTESWPELVQRLAPGKPVIVTMASGSEVAGRVSAISADSLGLMANGVSRQFAVTEVRQVRRNGDSLWNGLAIGMGIGATVAALPDPRYYNCGGSALCKDKQTPERLTLFASVMLTGILIDALRRDRTILYQPPFTPIPKGAHPTKK